MRLKTKIILICCISTLFSTIVCSTAVYLLVKSNSIDAAQAQSVQNALAGFTELEKKITALEDRTGREPDWEVLQYFMKQQKDDMLLCFVRTAGREEIEVYNETVFAQADLESLPYHPLSDLAAEEAELAWGGRLYTGRSKEARTRYISWRILRMCGSA